VPLLLEISTLMDNTKKHLFVVTNPGISEYDSWYFNAGLLDTGSDVLTDSRGLEFQLQDLDSNGFDFLDLVLKFYHSKLSIDQQVSD
jgi:hypothetical protein